MADKSEKQLTPPYTSYGSFSNFIGTLRSDGLPSRIDRSVMTNLSGSVQSAILSACRWLELVDEEGTPTERLKRLVQAGEEEYPQALRSLLEDSYSFLNDGFDLKNATGAQVAEQFRKRFGIQGSTVNKCMSFFLHAAEDAGIEVSRHVKPPPIQKGGGARRKKKVRRKKAPETGSHEQEAPHVERERASEMVKITVPLHDMRDGEIWFPKGMNGDQWSYALQMARLILEHYRPDIKGGSE